MTQEQKAKAYDAALENAKKAILKCRPLSIETNLTVAAVLQLVFPQLRESEDERIRKELIEFIKWSVDRHFMREDFHQAKRPSEWIAYLEKQKVPKHAPDDLQKSFEAGQTSIVENPEQYGLCKKAESEDERIRKCLVKLLTNASEAYLVESTGIKKGSYLAYLERQKELPFVKDIDKKGGLT